MMHTKEEILAAISRLIDVQHRLRQDCPWDRKQTFESLRTNTIEEVYELSDALASGDRHEVMKELGDIMEHVLFYSILGEESDSFDLADVCHQQSDKLMFRHPFINWKENGDWYVNNPSMQINEQGQVVYTDEQTVGSDKPQNADEVLSTWEQIKQRERDGNKSVLSGVPQSLPSVIKAFRIQEKAANVGFDWKQRNDVWQKVREELDELQAELERGDQEKSTCELGDYIFSLINAARLYHINPDNALEKSNQKFIRRFNYIEEKAKEQHKTFKQLTLEEMEQLWNEAKNKEEQS